MSLYEPPPGIMGRTCWICGTMMSKRYGPGVSNISLIAGLSSSGCIILFAGTPKASAILTKSGKICSSSRDLSSVHAMQIKDISANPCAKNPPKSNGNLQKGKRWSVLHYGFL